jgi:uncharacterized protein (DUF1330 family)
LTCIPEETNASLHLLHHGRQRSRDLPQIYILTPQTLTRYQGKFLTRGDKVVTLEGREFTERMVLLEFPDSALATAWYNDADYQSLPAFRRASSKGAMWLQESRDNPTNPDPLV